MTTTASPRHIHGLTPTSVEIIERACLGHHLDYIALGGIGTTHERDLLAIALMKLGNAADGVAQIKLGVFKVSRTLAQPRPGHVGDAFHTAAAQLYFDA